MPKSTLAFLLLETRTEAQLADMLDAVRSDRDWHFSCATRNCHKSVMRARRARERGDLETARVLMSHAHYWHSEACAIVADARKAG